MTTNVIRIASERAEATCHPGRGFLISSIVDKLHGLELLWRLPRPLEDLSDQLGPPGAGSADTFHRDIFRGGWFALIPNSGPAAGPSSWMHGTAARRPWRLRAVSANAVHAELDLAGGIAVTRSVRASTAGIEVETEIRNETSFAVSMTVGEHPCFPRELLAGGALDAGDESPAWTTSAPDPALSAVPEWRRVPKNADGRNDHVFVSPADGSVRLVGPARPIAAIRWDPRIFSAALVWQHYAPAGNAWGADGDIVAIEPVARTRRVPSDATDHGSLDIPANDSISYVVSIDLL